MVIAVSALFTAFLIGLFFAEIIWTVLTFSKAARYKNRIRVKNAYPWLTVNWAVLLFFAVKFFTEIFSLNEFDYKFTEKTFSVLTAIGYGTMTLNILFRMIFAVRAYITDDGIISASAFFPKGKARYEVEKSEVGTFITLYTKKKSYDFTFTFKQKYEKDIIDIMDFLGYEKYDENNAAAPYFRKQSYVKRNLIILLCTALVFIGGLFGWYSITKPVVFVGDKIVRTDSEQAILNSIGCVNLLLHQELTYFPELEENFDKIAESFQHSENLTSKDMAALKQMPNLKHLSVTYNDIDDLTDIGELTQLEMFAMGGNGAWRSIRIYPKDYSPLKNLTNLKYFVGLGLQNFNDLTVFENTDDLEYFELTAAEIKTGLDIICEKENLLVLNLLRCKIDDFTPIGKCAKLKALHIGETNVDDLSFLKNLIELEYLYIPDIDVDDYSVLLEMPKLEYVFIKDTEIPREIIDGLTEKGVIISD